MRHSCVQCCSCVCSSAHRHRGSLQGHSSWIVAELLANQASPRRSRSRMPPRVSPKVLAHSSPENSVRWLQSTEAACLVPCVESYLNMYAMYSASMKGSLMATILMSLRSRAARMTRRPIRPKPAREMGAIVGMGTPRSSCNTPTV